MSLTSKALSFWKLLDKSFTVETRVLRRKRNFRRTNYIFLHNLHNLHDWFTDTKKKWWKKYLESKVMKNSNDKYSQFTWFFFCLKLISNRWETCLRTIQPQSKFWIKKNFNHCLMSSFINNKKIDEKKSTFNYLLILKFHKLILIRKTFLIIY